MKSGIVLAAIVTIPRHDNRAEWAESELQRQQERAIDHVNQVAENETQDLIVVQRPTWIIVHSLVDV